MKNKIDIYHYLNFRNYLSDLFHSLKESENLSLRKFALKADFGSHSYLKQIMEGKRDISEKSILKIAKGFNLNKSETKYFNYLVKFTQEKNIENKNNYYKKLIKFRPKDSVYELEEKQYRFFSNWYNIPIRELVSSEDFEENPEKIAENLEPSITPDEVKKSIKLLLEIGLLKKDKSGKLIQNENNISTGDEVSEQAVANYHFNLLDLAKRSIEKTEQQWRDISSLCFLINREEFLYIKKSISEFRKNILQYLSDRKKGQFPEDINGKEEILYQLNMQLFNSSKIKWKSIKK